MSRLSFSNYSLYRPPNIFFELLNNTFNFLQLPKLQNRPFFPVEMHIPSLKRQWT